MDSYRRLLQMFGATVLGIESEVFAKALDQAEEGPRHHLRHRPRRRRPARPGRDLQAGDPRARRPRLPAGPARAARAGDARGLRLVEHRARRPLPPPGAHRRGHGYGGQRAGDGLRQPRRRLGLRRRLHPRPGVREPGRVRRLPAERPGRGRRRRASATPSRWRTWSEIDKASHDELLTIMDTLEKHYRDMCDIEFTVERGKLWMLQTRVGKRTPQAAFRIGRHMTDEGLIDTDESLRRVTGAQLAQLMFPRFDEKAERTLHREGHERLPRCRRRQGGLRLRHRRRVGRARRGRDPGPQGDQPRRPARHGRRQGHPDQPRRQDLARGRRRPRHGPHLRLRRRGARRELEEEARQGPRRRADPRGRRHLDRRHHRRGLPRRRARSPTRW